MKNAVNITCNRCKSQVDAGGYSVDLSTMNDDVSFELSKGLDLTKTNHYCGKRCLMLVFDGVVDAISGIRSAAA